MLILQATSPVNTIDENANSTRLMRRDEVSDAYTRGLYLALLSSLENVPQNLIHDVIHGPTSPPIWSTRLKISKIFLEFHFSSR
jgi:hypothetical protein